MSINKIMCHWTIKSHIILYFETSQYSCITTFKILITLEDIILDVSFLY